MEIINESAEKFRDKQDEICDFLFGVLKEFNAVEKDAWEQSKILKEEKLKSGIPEHQVSPEESKLWDEYEAKLNEIRPKYLTEKHIQRGYCPSIRSRQKYGYLNESEPCNEFCKANFIMKSAKKAVVIMHFNMVGLDEMHKFVIVNIDGKWLIDAVYHGFEDEPDKWSIMVIC